MGNFRRHWDKLTLLAAGLFWAGCGDSSATSDDCDGTEGSGSCNKIRLVPCTVDDIGLITPMYGVPRDSGLVPVVVKYGVPADVDSFPAVVKYGVPGDLDTARRTLRCEDDLTCSLPGEGESGKIACDDGKNYTVDEFLERHSVDDGAFLREDGSGR